MFRSRSIKQRKGWPGKTHPKSDAQKRGLIYPLQTPYTKGKSPLLAEMLLPKSALVIGMYLLSVSGNQQVIGSPCQLAICHWSPSVGKTYEERRPTLIWAITFQLTFLCLTPDRSGQTITESAILTEF